MSKPKNFSFRDVNTILQKLRNVFLGRKYVLHGRFPPMVSPRSIPPVDIPRGTNLKYSDQYYFKRNAYHSVKPPVVGKISSTKTKGSSCEKIPTPGCPWWWDGHSYYECTLDDPECKKPKKT